MINKVTTFLNHGDNRRLSCGRPCSISLKRQHGKLYNNQWSELGSVIYCTFNDFIEKKNNVDIPRSVGFYIIIFVFTKIIKKSIDK